MSNFFKLFLNNTILLCDFYWHSRYSICILGSFGCLTCGLQEIPVAKFHFIQVIIGFSDIYDTFV